MSAKEINKPKCEICGKFLKLVKSNKKVYIEGVGYDYYYWYECKTHGKQDFCNQTREELMGW